MRHTLLLILTIIIGMSVIAGCTSAQTCPKIGDKAPELTGKNGFRFTG